METKICKECKTEKKLSEFYANSETKDKREGTCKECRNKAKIEYNHTFEGWLSRVYGKQKSRSKDKWGVEMGYTKDELREFVVGSHACPSIFDKWAESGYLTSLRPSIDRIDSSIKKYTLDNIQLITWGENSEKSKSEKRKNGIKHYEKTATRRRGFQDSCDRKKGWKYEHFNEIDSGEKIGTNTKYFYILKPEFAHLPQYQ